MLLLAFPDQENMQYILTRAAVTHTDSLGKIRLFMLMYHGKVFLAVLCGYGKVNTVRALTLAAEKYSVDSILGVGTAGTLETWTLGSPCVEIPTETFQYDVNMVKLNHPPVTLPNMSTGFYPSNGTMNEKAKNSASVFGVPVRTGRIASADCFTADDAQRIRLQKDFNAAAVDVECGALGQFAFLNDIPFTAIKTICNSAGSNAAAQYRTFGREATLLAQKIALRYVEKDENG